MTNNSQITEDQHIVPRFYFKRFADIKNFLQVMDAQKKVLLRPKPYAGVCYASFFYGIETGKPDDISQEVENWLKTIENGLASKLPCIIKKILNDEQITRMDKYNLSIFMTMLWLRSAKMRKQINNFHEQMYKKINSSNAEAIVKIGSEQKGIKLMDKEKKDIEKMLKTGDYELSFNNANHLMFLIESLGIDGKPGFSNALANKYWRIYVNKTKIPFVTSDAPVSEWQKPPSTFYNIEGSFLAKEHFFALTPEIFIEMTYPHVGVNWKVKKKTLLPGDEDKVMMYNLVTASKAHEEVYSSKKSIFEEMIHDFSSAKSRFGRMYLERFEFPWVAHERKYGKIRPRESLTE